MEVLHTAIQVSDLDQTRAFYEDALGLEHSWDFVLDGVRNYYVTGDEESGAEIQFQYDPDRDGDIEPAGIDHIAITVADVDATVDRLVAETDTEVISPPSDVADAGARTAFITDPDGYVLELIQRLE